MVLFRPSAGRAQGRAFLTGRGITWHASLRTEQTSPSNCMYALLVLLAISLALDKARMRISIILARCFPPDVRVENEALSLIEAGHEVHVVCWGHQNQSSESTHSDIAIHRIFPSHLRLIEKLNSLIYKASFLDPLWFLCVFRLCQLHYIEVLHVIDLPLMRTAILVSKLLRIPVVFDMFEQWPEKAVAWRVRPSIWERMSTYSYRRLKTLERFALQASDYVTCASDFDIEYIRQSGIPLDKVTVVPNYVDTRVFDPSRQFEPPAEAYGYAGKWVILYVGTMGYHRGLDTAIRAMPHVVEAVPNAALFLGGHPPPDVHAWLERIIDETGMQERVKLLGWIEYSDIPRHLAECQVSIMPFPAGLPAGFESIHKAFQTMAMGRPMIITDAADYREGVEALGCGLVVPPDNPRALADAVIELYRNPNLAETLGGNGRQAVERYYNWTTSGQRLVKLYERIETT